MRAQEYVFFFSEAGGHAQLHVLSTMFCNKRVWSFPTGCKIGHVQWYLAVDRAPVMHFFWSFFGERTKGPCRVFPWFLLKGFEILQVLGNHCPRRRQLNSRRLKFTPVKLHTYGKSSTAAAAAVNCDFLPLVINRMALTTPNFLFLDPPPCAIRHHHYSPQVFSTNLTLAACPT